MIRFDKKKVLKIFPVIVLVLASFLAGGFLLNRGNDGGNDEGAAGVSTEKKEDYLEKTKIGKRVKVKGKDENGVLTDKDLVITVSEGFLTEKIGVIDQALTTKDGKLFVVVNFEIENENDERMVFNSISYVRLVDSKGKKYAPEFYNEPFLVEPHSVRDDQIGFLINEDEKEKVKLLVGEMTEGKGEEVKLNF